MHIYANFCALCAFKCRRTCVHSSRTCLHTQPAEALHGRTMAVQDLVAGELTGRIEQIFITESVPRQLGRSDSSATAALADADGMLASDAAVLRHLDVHAPEFRPGDTLVDL